METSRRSFIRKAALTGSAILAAPSIIGASQHLPHDKVSDATEQFKLKYAPGFDSFSEHAGEDPVDNIKFCHDMGFRAMFDNGLMGRPVEVQEKIASEINRQGMELGPFVLYADFSVTSFVLNKPEIKEMLVKKMQEGVDVAKRTGVKWALVVPGRYDERLHIDYQTANVIDNLRYCCDILEPAGLTMVLEPLNTLRNHPGLFLTRIPQTYEICEAVNRPVCIELPRRPGALGRGREASRGHRRALRAVQPALPRGDHGVPAARGVLAPMRPHHARPGSVPRRQRGLRPPGRRPRHRQGLQGLLRRPQRRGDRRAAVGGRVRRLPAGRGHRARDGAGRDAARRGRGDADGADALERDRGQARQGHRERRRRRGPRARDLRLRPRRRGRRRALRGEERGAEPRGFGRRDG